MLKLQVKELELQRKELTLTQKTLEAQRQEMVEQNKTLQIQRFENTFFSLLDTFNGIIEVLEYENTHTLNKSTGRMVFHDYELEATIAHSIVDNVELNKWFQDKDTLFGPYFRMLYNILLFVERSEVIIQIDGYPNKSFYIHLLRDQLTSHELLFLACIGLYSEGKESFKEFSEKYTLLKMLDKVSPFMPFFEEQYDRSAFG